MNLITLENISKSYSEKKLVENISLGINDKEKIGLIGVNGTGKSTLLKIIAGAEIPDDGTITKANKVRIEYLPQNPYYDEDATVLEQVFKGTCEEMKIIGDYQDILDKINKSYSRIEVFIFGKLVVIRINVLIDDFDKYYGEATDDLRNIPALAHLSDTLEVRTPGSLRTSDNVTTLKQCGTVLISGGKIFAAIPEKIISSGYISGQIITYLLQ